MGLFSKDIRSMEDLFEHLLEDIYYAEHQILKAQPKMIEKADDGDLRDSLSSHLRESRGHVERLETVFGLLDLVPKGTTCPAIDGILKEADEVVAEVADAAVQDAAIVAAVQAVEHYEITRYGTLCAWARELGRDDIAVVFEATLAEEYAADDTLTKLAEGRINRAA